MKTLILIALVSCISFAHASVRVGDNSFAPENSLWIDVDDKAAAGITEEEFNIVLDKMFDIYKPLAAAKGATLVNTRDWKDGTVNSYASQSGKTWKVASFGGLARYKGMTMDAFALVACHELGHHMGGAPKYKKVGGTWASSEGQSDYYGTLKCMKRYLENEDNIGYLANVEVPVTVSQKCNMAFNNSNEAAICIRASLAGYVLAVVLKELSNGKEISFDTPDTNVVAVTLFDKYPAVQCRLDSYFTGALCNKSVDDDVSPTDATAGACNGSETGARPLCWYKP